LVQETHQWVKKEKPREKDLKRGEREKKAKSRIFNAKNKKKNQTRKESDTFRHQKAHLPGGLWGETPH